MTPTSERFWNKVDRRGPDECWLWTGSNTGNGYGQLNDGWKKPPAKAHRVSWEIHHGPIPEGMSICHTCDVRLCVNPSHLFLGTQKDNMQDASQKGRMNNANARKTHCLRGHPFDEENTHHRRDGGRQCRACNAAY